jgi:hypothetical protein
MGFLRRLFGGGEPGEGAHGDEATGADGDGVPDDRAGTDRSTATGAADPMTSDEEERAHEIELSRQEAARLDDLQQRQLRYADYAWTPPAQGGEKRADHEGRPTDG